MAFSKLRLNGEVKYVASFSGGKDSLAMVLKLIKEGYPLDYVVFFDTGMEFDAIYRNLEKIRSVIEQYGAQLVILKPPTDFLTDMLLKPVNVGTDKEHYGYEWCGGVCRWRTHDKIKIINDFLKTLPSYIQYIGIAADEPARLRDENNKLYPLAEWGMAEKDALQYCRDNGWDWKEGEYDLYDLLDRVSCWCCANKNLKELRNIYHYLPKYWGWLKGLQSRIDRPFHSGKTIFELEERFQTEDSQISIFDIMESCG